MRSLFRATPNGPPGAYDTYGVRVPRATHTIPVSCTSVGCEHYENGWACTVIPDSAEQKTLIDAADGRIDGMRRQYLKPERTPEGWLRYVFPAGQPCFAASAHVEQIKPATTLIQRGDWRRHERPSIVSVPEWTDRLGENQQRIIDRQSRG